MWSIWSHSRNTIRLQMVAISATYNTWLSSYECWVSSGFILINSDFNTLSTSHQLVQESSTANSEMILVWHLTLALVSLSTNHQLVHYQLWDGFSISINPDDFDIILNKSSVGARVLRYKLRDGFGITLDQSWVRLESSSSNYETV